MTQQVNPIIYKDLKLPEHSYSEMIEDVYGHYKELSPDEKSIAKKKSESDIAMLSLYKNFYLTNQRGIYKIRNGKRVDRYLTAKDKYKLMSEIEKLEK